MAAATASPRERPSARQAHIAGLSRPERSPYARASAAAAAQRRRRDGPDQDTFEPALLSLAENRALLKHLTSAVSVALADTTEDADVNPVEIKKWITALAELDALEKHNGTAWAGYEAIADSITRYLDDYDRCLQIQEDGGPRYPSFYGIDSSGDAYRGLKGADSGIVRSQHTEDGERRPFTVYLRRAGGTSKAALPWARSIATQQVKAHLANTVDEILTDAAKGIQTCSICQYSLSFKVGDKTSERLSLGRMARHFKSAKTDRARHEALARRVFR